MSATLSSDVTSLQNLVLKNPQILDLADQDSHRSNLSQYYVCLSEEDKFLLVLVLLKLKLVRGKCLVFVNSIDRGFRLKMFLEQFGLRIALLNEELPANSRYHTVVEFNKGVYDYIIATDGGGVGGGEEKDIEGEEEEEDEEEEVEKEQVEKDEKEEDQEIEDEADEEGE